jgi:DNA-binding response OmpR family regulator
MIDKPIVIAFEDDPKIAETYEEMITELGGDIVVTASAVNGLALIRQLKPKLVLLDIMLDGVKNGFDILEEIRRNEDTKNIPVVMLTNLDSEEKVARSIGVEDYIVKSNIALTDLQEKLKTYLQ